MVSCPPVDLPPVAARSPDRATPPDGRSPSASCRRRETFGPSPWPGQETGPQQGGRSPWSVVLQRTRRVRGLTLRLGGCGARLRYRGEVEGEPGFLAPGDGVEADQLAELV